MTPQPSNSPLDESTTNRAEGSTIVAGVTIPPPIRIAPEPTEEEIEAMIPRRDRRRRRRWLFRH